MSIWPSNSIRETNDDYENYANIHQQEESQQPILNHQQEGENQLYYNYSRTRQMGDNINTNNEQRQFSGNGGGNGGNNNNVVSRKKTNNGKKEKRKTKRI